MNNVSMTTQNVASPSASDKTVGVWSMAWRGLLKPARVLVLPGPGHTDAAQAAPSDLPVPAFDAALLAWRDWCSRHAGQRCKVALSSAWTLTGLVPDEALAAQAQGVHATQTTQATQAIEHMSQQWAHYMGMGAATLSRDWLVRATRVQAGWLVCATPRQLVDDLLMLAQRHRVRVVWMGPWWTNGLQRWARRAPAALLHIVEPGWCLHVESQTSLSRVWAAPVPRSTQGADPLNQTHPFGTRVVSLSRHGAAMSACVWDDAATQDLIDGKASAWSGKGAPA
jgi:hypothetical protein